MNLRFGPLALGGVAALTAALLASNDARACGGCFHPEDQPQTETTVVTGHRMALSISTTQTVLWDQVQYSGSPSEFAWVLPVKPGARIEVANNAWFEALDAATSTRVVPPQLNCLQQSFGGDEGGSGCGCSSLSAASFDSASGGSGEPNIAPTPPPVTVVYQGSVGPYDTVTLHANVPGSLTTWLSKNGFAVDTTIKPIIDAYTNDGFDFIALRLQPDQGIQQMRPVRVVSPGAVPVLPLRMVAAGTGANVALTLFVIGEGRWETKNFPNAVVDPKTLSWDFTTADSNYAELRQDHFTKNDGRRWLNTYALPGSLLTNVANPTNPGAVVQYTTAASDPGGSTSNATTIAELYIRQGLSEGIKADGSCLNAFPAYANSQDLVVDVCPNSGDGSGGGGAGGSGAGGGAPACGSAKPGETDARNLACGSLDDVAVALTGMHPSDVWLTRLEANLPRAALTADLELQATAVQDAVENWLTASELVNPPCTLAAVPVAPPPRGGGDAQGPRRRRGLGNFAALATGLAALGAMLGRRKTRRPRLA